MVVLQTASFACSLIVCSVLFLFDTYRRIARRGHVLDGSPAFLQRLELALGFFLLAEIGCRAAIVEDKIVFHVHLENVLGETFYSSVPMAARIFVERPVDDRQDGLGIETGQAPAIDQVLVVPQKQRPPC